MRPTGAASDTESTARRPPNRTESSRTSSPAAFAVVAIALVATGAVVASVGRTRDRWRPKRSNTVRSFGLIERCPPCVAMRMAKSPKPAFSTFGERAPWKNAGITAVIPANTAYHGSRNGASVKMATRTSE